MEVHLERLQVIAGVNAARGLLQILFQAIRSSQATLQLVRQSALQRRDGFSVPGEGGGGETYGFSVGFYSGPWFTRTYGLCRTI